jgi:arylsulfatase A-like enzyme
MLAAEPRGLPFHKILPQYLKDLGYVTRAVGKWHLGFHKKEYTPVYRGFDSHLGYWSGFISYYDHIAQDIVSNVRKWALFSSASVMSEFSGTFKVA